jgi:hypothetical protein
MKPGPKLGSKQPAKPQPTHSFAPTLKQVEFIRLRIIESLESCGYALIRKANTDTSWGPLDEVVRIEIEHAKHAEYWFAIGDAALVQKKNAKAAEAA